MELVRALSGLIVASLLTMCPAVTQAQVRANDAAEKTYRIIASQVVGSDQYRNFFKVMAWKSDNFGCPPPLSQAAEEALGVMSIDRNGSIIAAGRGKSVVTVAGRCVIDISTTCWGGAMLELPSSVGTWNFVRGRIAFAAFIRALGAKYHVPASLTEPQAVIMEQLGHRYVSAALGHRTVDDDPFVKQSDDAERELATTWDNYRESNNLVDSIPGLSWDPGCGFSPTFITFQTKPAGGHVRIISDLDFLVCQATGVTDPWSSDACHGWVDAVTVMSMVGTYRYTVSWKGSSLIKGTLPIYPCSEPRKQPITLPDGDGGLTASSPVDRRRRC